MNYLVSLLKEIYIKRKLILDLSKADFKKAVCRLLFRYCMDVSAADCDSSCLLFCVSDGI